MSGKKHNPIMLAAVCALIFFLFAFFTLPHYGVSWDEALHFRRGQAYLYFFLTGDLDYRKLPAVNLQGSGGDPAKVPEPRRSFYQNDTHNGKFMMEQDSGHPPLNGELAAVFNYILFQKLGVLDDVSSHHVFNITASSLLVFVVVAFAAESLGFLAGVVSFLALVTYPLFWAEAHFNIKDPPEAAFFTATIWAFYNSLNKRSIFWLLGSFVFLGLALGTKFNAFFIPLIVGPYLIIRYWSSLKHPGGLITNFPRKYLVFLIVGCLLTASIFVGSWPYLWQDWPGSIYKIFGYYKEIGLGVRYQPDQFFLLGFNIFPALWILFTTPPFVLLLSAMGVVAALTRHPSKGKVSILWLLLFLVPIIRVTMPGAVIYGGIRQILEFLPGMALLSGFGAWQINQWSKGRKILSKVVPFVTVALFLWPIFVLIKMHPNENVYFNSFIGGLSGAETRNFPSWGNSFGNAYFQGTQWINQNVGQGAKVALLQGTLANAPLIYFRPDIKYIPGNEDQGKKNFFSGINREGEYIMELTYNDSGKDFFYRWEYVEKFLIPVYELQVDNVAILKIWKNDLEHTKPEKRSSPVDFTGALNIKVEDRFLYLDLIKPLALSSIEVDFKKSNNCTVAPMFMETSSDQKNWQNEKDSIPQYQMYGKSNVEEGKVVFYFAERVARYVRLAANSGNACIFNNPIIKITSF